MRLAHDWVTKQFAADGEYLYWAEGTTLHQGRVSGGRVADVLRLTHGWGATQLTAGGGYLYWTDGDRILRQGRVVDGKIVDVVATKFASNGVSIYWVESDHNLRIAPVP